MGYERSVLLPEPPTSHILNSYVVYRYLKKVDSFQNNHLHAYLTGGNVKFMLLMNADPEKTTYANYSSPPPSRPTTARQSLLLAANPTAAQTEEAVRGFMTEVSHVVGCESSVGGKC